MSTTLDRLRPVGGKMATVFFWLHLNSAGGVIFSYQISIIPFEQSAVRIPGFAVLGAAAWSHAAQSKT